MRLRHRTLTGLVMAGALALAACGGGGDDGGATDTTATSVTPGGGTATLPPTTTIPPEQLPPCPVEALDSAPQPVNIQFWHAMSAALNDALVKLTDRYNASQSKVRVTLVANGGYDDNFDKYRTASKADRPAMIQLPEYQVQAMMDSGTILPVQSCVNASNHDLTQYLERAIGYYSAEGALQAMPFNVSNPILYYNKQVFEKAGLDPEKPPVTLEELRAYSEQIVRSGAAKYGLAFDSSPDGGGGWFVEQWLAKSGELFADNNNGRTARATRVLFDNPTTVELLTFMQQMVKDGLAVNVGRNPDAIQVLLKLVDSKEPAAMGLNTSSALAGALEAAKGFPQITVGAGPMPGPNVADGGVLVGGAALWLVADRDPAQTAAAWDFIRWLTAAEQQAEWGVTTGYLPVNKGALDVPLLKDTWAAQPVFRVAYDQLTTGPTNVATAGAILGPQRSVREVIAKGFEDILAGADVATTVTRMAAEADRVLADYAKRVGG